MQKLPEVSDRKKGRRMRKENGASRQKEEAHSLSTVNGELTASLSLNYQWKPTWPFQDATLGKPFTSCTRLGLQYVKIQKLQIN